MRILLALLFFCSVVSVGFSALNAGDLLAFQKLYVATNGTNWFRQPSSLSNPCGTNVEGRTIICVSGRIREITLRGNNLRGTLPTEIGLLTNLLNLDLSSQPGLTGTIPTQIGKLKALKTFAIQEASLTGTVPTEITALTALTTLSLQSNRLESPLPDLTLLTNLATLQLRFNLICPVPNFSSWAQSNDYWNPPTCACASNSCVRGTCSNEGTTPGDYTCDCTGTGYYGTYCQNPSPHTATILALYQNTAPESWIWKPNTTLPICLMGWRIKCNSDGEVIEINLAGNGLRGTIPDLSAITTLQILDLSSNSLYGTIPAFVSSLTSLRRLALGGNSLSGNLPSLSGFSALQELILESNLLSGTIHTQYGSLSALKYLDLGENLLTGAIPTQLGSLTNLLQLRLDQNKLSSGIPAELGGLSSLKELDLHGNALTGNVPIALDTLSLRILRLRSNQLSGTVSNDFSNNAFEFLELSGNSLCFDDYSSWATVSHDYGTTAPVC